MESYIKCSIKVRGGIKEQKTNKKETKNKGDEKNSSINKTEERVGFFKNQKVP